MNKKELIKNISGTTGYANKDVEIVTEEVFTQIANALARGEKVSIYGFGDFEARDRDARKGRNPQTGEEIEIPAKRVPAFKPKQALKDIVNI